MDAVLRGTAIYLFLLVLLRFAGRRTLGQLTTFDFVLLLIISEATQQALLGEDFSITNAFLVIMTMIGLDIGLSLLKQRFIRLQDWLEGMPIVLIENGRLLKDRMNKERVDEDDILQAAREAQGIERIEQIKYAVLERTGGISIIPKREG
ncbi:MAG TPA: YetF domain-containing protein [Thermodesulfobacteriota bacterium]|nr:YetF domain-containing protein [Thermodesulfobacteriota bacterium]